jgi:hypothetical protein
LFGAKPLELISSWQLAHIGQPHRDSTYHASRFLKIKESWGNTLRVIKPSEPRQQRAQKERNAKLVER